MGSQPSNFGNPYNTATTMSTGFTFGAPSGFGTIPQTNQGYPSHAAGGQNYAGMPQQGQHNYETPLLSQPAPGGLPAQGHQFPDLHQISQPSTNPQLMSLLPKLPPISAKSWKWLGDKKLLGHWLKAF